MDWKLEMNLPIWTNIIMFQPAKLEIMKVKERSLFEECGKVYAHFNFLVINDSDGTRTLFFAEVDFLNCKEEKDVYLCCPLEENDNGK